ncbi:AAA domain-containing protein [Prauserella oleivorans]|uniref:AAA domain-containing protein n=1 Tax=Prauserella oleivorans TaxID=1478153 RepID=A0ABW5WBQ7_9PSEU
MANPENDPALKDRVVRLMGFLRKLAIKRSTPVRHIADHAAVLWLSEATKHVPIDEDVISGGRAFVVPKVQVDPEPVAPDLLRFWVDTDGDEPVLRPRGPHPTEHDIVDLEDVPAVKQAFDRWLSDWRAWATAQAHRLALKKIHATLADMERHVSQQPESLEIVLASGLFQAATEYGRPIKIHLLTQPIRIDYDRETGDIHCVIADDTEPRLEDDEIIGDFDFFDRNAGPPLREKLQSLGGSPVNPEVTGFFKQWAERALDTVCSVTDEWEASRVGKSFRLDFAPAIVLRSRGSYALRRYYETIAGALEEPDTPVPLGLAQLVEPIEATDKLAWLERTGATAATALADDPLFPLPANDQQRDVIRRLGEDSGVVVEGPPGTGKTHTIANLMSALLARGQRILVTSEKAQALRVLRDKLPPQMQDLCVSMTAIERKGRSALTKSVTTLSERHSTFDARASDRRIRELSARREREKQQRAKLLEDIRALRESERYEHPEIAAGYSGTLSTIVRKLNKNSDLGWIRGRADGDCPLSTDEFSELVRLLREETDERRSRRTQDLPRSEDLPDEYLIAGLVNRVQQGNDVTQGEQGALVSSLGTLTDERFHQLRETCERAAETVNQLRSSPADPTWVDATTAALFGQQHEYLWQSAANSLTLIDEALRCDQAVGFADVATQAIPPAAGRAFHSFGTYLQSGGKLRKLGKKPEQKAVEEFLPSVRVAGSAVTTADTAFQVANHLRVIEIGETVRVAFAPLGYAVHTVAPRSAVVDQLVRLRDLYQKIEQVRSVRTELIQLLTALPPAMRPRLGTLDDILDFADHAIKAEQAYSAKLAAHELASTAEQISALVPAARRAPEHDDLLAAIGGQDADRYQDSLRRLERAWAQRQAQLRCDALLSRLTSACPTLAEDLSTTASKPEWTDRVSTWPQAWAHACATAWVEEQTRLGREQELETELESTTQDLESVTAELAAERAWNSCLRRMTSTQVGALRSYASNTANIGKGTGKFTERFREAAREAMSVAQDAVPAWVMPIQQVLDTVPARQNAFDVIIVDEASQADLTSSFLLWLAPRVIVVGDDKQCTPPDTLAGALQPVFESLDAELHDVPGYLRTEFTPKSSMFSLLRSRFGPLVRLREHFRCMPEIIQWCSTEFYQDQPLVPVRQFGADRLPPLRAHYIEGSFVEGKNSTLVNPVEADAIADSIVGCLDDTAYENKTFGVVVLQGHRQIDQIKDALHKRGFGPDQWEERRLRIGTAADFQGDERHVVWLSMVVAPEQNFSALTRASFQRSFNVAVSRAQDQLHLFHSVTRDRLNPGDLRLSLLEHMTMDRLPLDPVLADVRPDVRHPQFDSLFEQRVYLDLVSRGYHVTPQVESNGRRIDLVVTGDGAKLAVECDGDHWHESAEQLAQDVYREQELKRCGWKFWRVRESAYYLDKERALASLWTVLETLKIRPILTDPAASAEPDSSVEPVPEGPTPEPPVRSPDTVPTIENAEITVPVVEVADADGGTWTEFFPWLARCRPGAAFELDNVAAAPGWWLTESPRSAWSAGAGTEKYFYGVASALLRLWPEAEPLASAFPRLPGDGRLGHLPFGTRARNLLRTVGAETAHDLVHLSWGSLLSTRGVGRRTVIDLLKTLAEAAVEPPPDVSATETSSRAERLPEPVGQYEDARHEVESWFDQFNGRELAIASKRLFADEPVTLQQLGDDHGITRERARQIEAGVRTKLHEWLAASVEVGKLLESLRAKIQPVAAMQRLVLEHPILDERVGIIGRPLWFVLDKLDDYFEVVDGWALAPNVRETRERTRLLLEDLTDQHGVASLSDLDRVLREFGMTEAELRSWLEWCEYELMDGHVLTRPRSITDRVAALLSVCGEPLTADTMAERLQLNSARGWSDRLAHDDRFKRVDRGTWALSEWDFDEYTTIRDQIGRVIDARAGSVPLHELIGELTSRFNRISETSIRTYAAAPPFETRNGVVTRSTAGPTRRKGPEQTRHLFRRDGSWAYRIVVTSDHLRGSGLGAPVGLATAIGLQPGDTVEFHSALGLQSVRWSGVQPQVASIKRFLERDEITVGTSVFLLFADDRSFTLEPAPTLPSEEGPLVRALAMIGVTGAASDSAEQHLANAVGLPSDAKRRQILRAYRDRGDDDVAEALEAAWTS